MALDSQEKKNDIKSKRAKEVNINENDIEDSNDQSTETKKLKVTDETLEEDDVVVKVDDKVDEIEQINYYLASALECIDVNDDRALDLIKITINESDKLLHSFHEKEPERFTATFYLAYGSALFYFGGMAHADEPEELEFLNLAEEKLNKAKELGKEEIGLLLEIELMLVKIMLSKALLVLKAKELGDDIKIDENEIIEKASSMLADLLNRYDDVLKYTEGKFCDLLPILRNSIEQIQDFADAQPFWVERKAWNLWAKEKYEKLNRIEGEDVSRLLGISNCLISMTNLYLEHVSSKGEDEEDKDDESDDDEDEDEDEDDEELKAEMNHEKATQNLTEALKLLNKAIELVKKDDNYDSASLAKLYCSLMEVYINLGNLSDQKEKQQEYHRNAIEIVEKVKEINCQHLLPEMFEHFVEDWKKELEENDD